MNDGDDDFLGVAYHEAGHAVVALALGLRVARVEVVPEDHSGATDVGPIGCAWMKPGSLNLRCCHRN